MLMHAYHDVLPGYHPDQILYDGCPECEERGQVVYRAITALDLDNYFRATKRAVVWNEEGCDNVSRAERALLETLWAVWLQDQNMLAMSAMGWRPS